MRVRENETPIDMDFANEVQAWALRALRALGKRSLDVTVGDAADHFKVSPEAIIRAVRLHYWMYIAFPGTNWGPAENVDEHNNPDAPITFDDPRRMVIAHEGE